MSDLIMDQIETQNQLKIREQLKIYLNYMNGKKVFLNLLMIR